MMPSFGEKPQRRAPITDGDRHCMEGHHPADRARIGQPIVERVYPLGEAGEALRHLIEDRPFGKVVLAG